VGVIVDVGVWVGVGVAVSVAVAVGVSVGGGVPEAVAVGVAVSVGVAVGVGVGVGVRVAVGVTVGVGVGSSVGKGVITASGGRIVTVSVRVWTCSPSPLVMLTVSTLPFFDAVKPAGSRARATGRLVVTPSTVDVRTSSLPDCWYWT
jgi:hypothetical protein